MLPTVHFDAKLTRRSDEDTARSVGQPGSGSSPKIGGTVDAVEISPTDVSTCDEYITPACLRALYGLDYTPIATSKNSYGIGEYSSYYYYFYIGFLNGAVLSVIKPDLTVNIIISVSC